MTDTGQQGPASVTVRSVAERAGVSVATVSRVLTGAGGVSPLRVRRVLNAADELNYRPDPIARSLATGSSRRVAVVVPNLSNPYFYDVLRGIGRACAKHGYTMAVADSMEEASAEIALARDMLQQSDAMILAAPRGTAQNLTALRGERKPVLMLLGPRDAVALPDVSVDNLAGMRTLYSHLAEQGHKRVAYLAGPTGSEQNQRRIDAIPFAQELGMQVDVVPAGGTIEAGREATARALEFRPTAITCFNDLVALGVLHCLTTHGFSVPQDISLGGFDDIDFSAYTAPALTTVRTPRELLGRVAWETLHGMLGGVSPPAAPADLPAQLVVRGSTGPAPRGDVDQAEE